MTKEQYLELLRKKLKRLPKEDFDRALEYFEEYFAEAGDENITQAIEDLGTPQMAADQIIREFAIGNSNSGDAKKDVRKGINGVWIVILAIFASPIALPLVIGIVAVLLALVVAVVSLFVAIGLSGVALIITAPVAIIGAFATMADSLPVALVCIGIALVSIACGILTIYATYLLIRRFLYWIVLVFGKMFAKGEKKDENE
ncbi:MAG TPA: DUF1700 domain-containing protein [Lachnospiraceae bacterium]|jgi:uncharacterized membrane protein|nr:DUF1700 domain-containing protein [Lachnospiraceae bacterium]